MPRESIKLTPDIVRDLGFVPTDDGWLVLKAVSSFYLKLITDEELKKRGTTPDDGYRWRFRTHISRYSEELDVFIPEHEVREVDEIMGFIFSDAFHAGEKHQRRKIKKAILGEDE